MVTRSGLTREFNLISKTRFKCMGTPYTLRKRKNFDRLKVDKKTFLLTALLLIPSGIFQVGSGLHTVISGGEKDHASETNWTGFIIVTGFCFIGVGNFQDSVYRDPRLMEEWITQVLNFERHRLNTEAYASGRPKVRPIMRLALLICKGTRVLMINGIPWVIGIFGAVMPSNPLNLANMYPGKLVLLGTEKLTGMVGDPGYINTFLSTVYSLAWNFFNYFYLMRGWTMLVTFTVIGSMSLSEAIFHFERNFSKEQPYGLTKMYREIQILATLFNKLMSSQLVIILLFSANIQIVCAMNVMDKGNSNVMMKAYFLWIMLNGAMAVGGLFGYCGDVHQTSSKCMDKIRSDTGVKKILDGFKLYKSSKTNREYTRMLRSLQMVRVNFGSVNYIEKMTPVMFQEFTGQRLVDMLLLQSS